MLELLYDSKYYLLGKDLFNHFGSRDSNLRKYRRQESLRFPFARRRSPSKISQPDSHSQVVDSPLNTAKYLNILFWYYPEIGLLCSMYI